MQSFWEWLEECASVWATVSEVFETSDNVSEVSTSKVPSPSTITVTVTLYHLLGWNLPFYTAGFV